MDSQEKKERYNENRKKKIAQRKEEREQEKKSGNTGRRRLAFARALIKQRGVTLSQVADRMGMTQQALSWIFNVQDDCYISVLKRMMDAIGIDCQVGFGEKDTHKAEEPQATADIFSFEGNVTIGKPKSDLPDYITDCPPDANMRFLADYIKGKYHNMNAFNIATGTNHTSMKGFFQHDDIKLSFLAMFAEKLNTKIRIKLNEKTREPDGM